jgi:hypothetical protein
VVEQELDLLLVGEAVERTGLELGEGVVVGREEGQAVVRVLELAGQLLGDLGGLQEAEQRRVLPATFKDTGQVELAGWGWTRGEVVGSRSEEERKKEKGEGGVRDHLLGDEVRDTVVCGIEGTLSQCGVLPWWVFVGDSPGQFSVNTV